VIVLPPRLRTNTSIPLALWLLRSPESPETAEDVLLVDGSDLATTGRSRYSLPDESISQLVELVDRWRTHRSVSPEDSALAVTVSREDILHNEASLLPARYRTPPSVDLDHIRREARTLRESLAESSVAAEAATAELMTYLESWR
jgi:type I restriction-modification system DNA methylase subunit